MTFQLLALFLALTLVSCQPDPNPPKAVAPTTDGPGDDDDRPLTMVGTSLDFTWDDKEGIEAAGDDTRVYRYSKSIDTRVNQVEYLLENDSGPLGGVVFRRKAKEPLRIAIAYGPPASPIREVEISTTAEEDASGTRVSPPNLKITSPSGADVRLNRYKKLGKFLLKHPRKGRKVRSITFDGVVAVTPNGAHGCILGTNPIVCTVNSGGSDNDSTLKISACRPVLGACPPTVP